MWPADENSCPLLLWIVNLSHIWSTNLTLVWKNAQKIILKMTHCKGWKTVFLMFWILFSTGPSPVAPFIRRAFLMVRHSIMTSQFFIWINHWNSQTTFGQSGDLTISSLLVLDFSTNFILFRGTFYSVIILQLVYFPYFPAYLNIREIMKTVTEQLLDGGTVWIH